MDKQNIKLLGIYYAAQKVLLNNLAAPLARSIAPALELKQHDSELVVQKALPFLKKGVNAEKLKLVIDKLFSQIDAGEIKPNHYLGQDFSAEETLEQLEKHDAFIMVYQDFVEQLREHRAEAVSGILEQVTVDLVTLKLNSVETLQLKALFADNNLRSPLTLTVEQLRDIVDSLYDATCKVLGPAVTDKMLSQAVKQANSANLNFNAATFL